MSGTSEVSSQQLPPYKGMFDSEELMKIERVAPGSVVLILGMIQADMEHIAAENAKELERVGKAWRLQLWLTFSLVVVIGAFSLTAILGGFPVSGSILATVDIAAVISAFLNGKKK